MRCMRIARGDLRNAELKTQNGERVGGVQACWRFGYNARMKINCLPMIPVVLLLALLVGGCQSTIVPLQPVQEVEYWVPRDGADTQPGGLAATMPTTAPATGPATQGADLVRRVRIVDPNYTVRYVYRANYDKVWQEAMLLLNDLGYVVDRRDYRMGVLTSKPLRGGQILEPWRPDHTGPKAALEGTINAQRRFLRLKIDTVPEKPEFYAIAVQVLVERELNPSGNMALAYNFGSGFGRNPLTARSDLEEARPEPREWNLIGRDVALEKKILDRLFKRI